MKGQRQLFPATVRGPLLGDRFGPPRGFHDDELDDQGAKLEAERARLIAAGVDPADLEQPIRVADLRHLYDERLVDVPRPKSRADQIETRFQAFHRANPAVWVAWCARCLELLTEGRTHYSARAVVDWIRSDTNLETTDEQVKLNNDFGAYYARMYLATHPVAGEFFKLRRLTTATKPANPRDLAVFYAGAARDEQSLTERLRKLAGET